MRNLYCTLILLLILFEANAQKEFEVTIISDATEQEKHFFEGAIKAEINALLGSQYELKFTEVYTDGDINNRDCSNKCVLLT